MKIISVGNGLPSDLIEEAADKPCVVLAGSMEEVAAVAKLWGQRVEVVPTRSECDPHG